MTLAETSRLMSSPPVAEGAIADAPPDPRLLLDSIAAGICSIDRNGAITFCNAAFLRLLGFQGQEEVIGKDIHGLIHHSRADGSQYLRTDCPVLKVAETGTPAHAIDEVLCRVDGTSFPVEYWAQPIAGDTGVEGAVCTFLDITERKQAQAEQRLLNRELSHRMKNTLAVAQAVVDQTFRQADDPHAAIPAINARLLALSRAHDVLMRTHWDGAAMADVAASGVAVYGADNSRISIEGAPVEVGPGTALALTMALHELCTNAIKYGALSNDEGRIELSWAVDVAAAEPRFRLTWKERGGPPVSAPKRKGFGSRIIHENCRLHFGTDVGLLFEPDGVEWTLDTALSAVKT